VYLTDLDYFCNKSWSVSFNFNTKSWISFHSYLPNWYLAEKNFFYSGLNDCCIEIDAIVAEVVPQPTTTTTTTIALDCRLAGTAVAYNCELGGIAEEISTPTTTTTTTTAEPTTTTTTTTVEPTTTTTTTEPLSPCVGYDLFAAESSSIEWFNCEGTFSSITFTSSFSICTDGSGYVTTIGSVDTISTYPCI
jgi:hypothetical protein